MIVDERQRSGPAAAPVWFALVATFIGLFFGYLLKAQCTRLAWDGAQYARLCYNDIQPLFHVRGVERGQLPYRDATLEYPVLTGEFMYLVGGLLRRVAAPAGNTDANYFHLSALLLAPFAFAVTLVLRPHVTRERLMIWALGTPIVLYAFHNWDLIAVAGGVVGLIALEQRRLTASGAALSLGASAKLFPGFLLPGALLGEWAAGRRREAARIAGAFALLAAVVNVPWMLVSWEGWRRIWTFHAERYPDFGSVWFWVAHHARRLVPATFWDVGQPGYRDFVGVASLILFIAGSAWFLATGWRRRNEPQGYPVAAVGLGVLVTFLLVSKVHSPQYALWIAPLLAMLEVPWRRLLAYLAADVAVYISGFYWFTVFSAPAPAWKGIFEVTVLVRAVTLVGLAMSAMTAVRVRPAEVTAAPAAHRASSRRPAAAGDAG
ncbi:MAG: glycosyltransferase 87 family protein [Actinomycetota bacterium]